MANGNNKPHRTRTTEPNTVSTRTEPPPIDPREPCRRPSRNDPTKPHQRNPTRTTPHRTHCLKRNPSARIKKIGCWDQRWEAGRSRSRRKAGKFRVGGISRLSAQAPESRDQAAATVPRDQGPGLQPGFKILPVLKERGSWQTGSTFASGPGLPGSTFLKPGCQDQAAETPLR